MTSLLGAGVILGVLAFLAWLLYRAAMKAGASGEVASNLKKGQEAEHVRREVETVVGTTDPVERSELRSRWTRD